MPTYPVTTESYGSYTWLLREVGGYLGGNYNRNTWAPEFLGKVDSIVQSGVMQLYYPPPMRDDKDERRQTIPHQWSFLSPVASLSIVAGTSEYDLPVDFSGVVSELTHTSGSTTTKVSIVSEPDLRQLHITAARTGSVQYAAVRPKSGDGTAAPRYQLLVYPVPDTNTTLKYRYSVAPSPLTEAAPWPLCGRQHAEALLQSCLAVAEERETKQQGAATARFLERLAAAVALDTVSAQPTDDGVWPEDNVPVDLTVDIDYLKRLIGRRIGIGPNKGSWTHKQAAEVDEAVRSGLRRFYTPLVLPGEKYAHEWSFLRPITSLTTTADDYLYDLPADFAMLDGPLTYDPGTSVLYPPIQLVSEHLIRSRRQTSQYSSRPQVAAIRVKSQGDGVRTMYEILFWPTPDAAYTINYRYKTNPALLSSGTQEPPGGQPHAQTIIESCLIATDELMGVKPSPHYPLFLECLRASVSHDRLANAPDTLGRNRDYSDEFDDAVDHRDYQPHVVTYNGVSY